MSLTPPLARVVARRSLSARGAGGAARRGGAGASPCPLCVCVRGGQPAQHSTGAERAIAGRRKRPGRARAVGDARRRRRRGRRGRQEAEAAPAEDKEKSSSWPNLNPLDMKLGMLNPLDMKMMNPLDMKMLNPLDLKMPSFGCPPPFPLPGPGARLPESLRRHRPRGGPHATRGAI